MKRVKIKRKCHQILNEAKLTEKKLEGMIYAESKFLIHSRTHFSALKVISPSGKEGKERKTLLVLVISVWLFQ